MRQCQRRRCRRAHVPVTLAHAVHEVPEGLTQREDADPRSSCLTLRSNQGELTTECVEILTDCKFLQIQGKVVRLVTAIPLQPDSETDEGHDDLPRLLSAREV